MHSTLPFRVLCSRPQQGRGMGRPPRSKPTAFPKDRLLRPSHPRSSAAVSNACSSSILFVVRWGNGVSSLASFFLTQGVIGRLHVRHTGTELVPYNTCPIGGIKDWLEPWLPSVVRVAALAVCPKSISAGGLLLVSLALRTLQMSPCRRARTNSQPLASSIELARTPSVTRSPISPGYRPVAARGPGCATLQWGP